jgi:hypothetical protein
LEGRPYASLFATAKGNWTKEAVLDAHLQVADLNLAVPLIALFEPHYVQPIYALSMRKDEAAQDLISKERAEFIRQATQSGATLNINRIEIVIDKYQSESDQRTSQSLCGAFTREWVRRFCNGDDPNIMQKLPGRFYIVSREAAHVPGRYERALEDDVIEKIQKLDLTPTDISCSAGSEYCTVVTKISPGTAAVWTTYASAVLKKPARDMAEIQARAVPVFVKYAIGASPDFGKMQAELTDIHWP